MSSNLYLLLKIVNRCRRTLRGEGHSPAKGDIGGSFKLPMGPNSVRWAMDGC